MRARAFVRDEDRAFVFDCGSYCELHLSDKDFVVMGVPCIECDDTEDGLAERDLTIAEESESLLEQGFTEVPYTVENHNAWLKKVGMI